MLVNDFIEIGNRLLKYRKKAGLTQMEVAEKAGVADRTYADIERGTVNMRMDTFLRICGALNVLPDEVLTKEDIPLPSRQECLLARLENCGKKERETALKLMDVYLSSLGGE